MFKYLDLKPDHEKHLICAAKMLNGEVFIDIGAHAGSWSVNMARNFEQVIAIEPNPKTFEVLKENTKSYNNIFPIETAIHSKIGHTILSEYAGAGSSTIRNDSCYVDEGKRPQHIYNVKTETLDSFILYGNTDFIKIDTEGNELNVLQGALEIIKNDTPILLIEIHHVDDIVKIGELLHNYNYMFENINDKYLFGHPVLRAASYLISKYGLG